MITLTSAEAADARIIWAACRVPAAGGAIYTVPNGVHLDDFAALPSGDPFREQWALGAGPVVLFLGRLHARKGLQLLIPAFAQASAEHPDARLVLAGPDEGMRAALEAQITEHKLGGRVVFTGSSPARISSQRWRRRTSSRCPRLAKASRWPCWRRWPAGCRCCSTPGCNFPEVVGAGAGVVVEREIAPLAGALRQFLADRDRCAEMGRAARALIEARYTWPQVVAQLQRAYADVVPASSRSEAERAWPLIRHRSQHHLAPGLLHRLRDPCGAQRGGAGALKYRLQGCAAPVAVDPGTGWARRVTAPTARWGANGDRRGDPQIWHGPNRDPQRGEPPAQGQPLFGCDAGVAADPGRCRVCRGSAPLLGYDAALRGLLAFAAINLLVDALGNMCHNQLLAIERMVIPAVIATGHIAVLVLRRASRWRRARDYGVCTRPR